MCVCVCVCVCVCTCACVCVVAGLVARCHGEEGSGTLLQKKEKKEGEGKRQEGKEEVIEAAIVFHSINNYVKIKIKPH